MRGLVDRGRGRAAMVAAAGFIVACYGALLWAGARGVPVRGYDDIFFTPAIQSAARGGLLVNPYVALGDTHVYLWHGWLYPTLMGLVPYAGDARRFGLALLIAAGIGIALFGAAMVRMRAGWTGAAAILAMFAVLLFQMGRPEGISSALIAGALLAARPPIDTRRFSAVFVVAMVLTGLVQPTVTVLLCLAFAILLAATARDWRTIAATLAVDGLCILGGVAALTELHPQMGFAAWVGGLAAQAGIVAGDWEGAIFVPYYLASVAVPLTVTYLLAVPLAGWWAWRRAGEAPPLAGRRAIVAGGVAVYLLLVWYLMVRVAHATYLLGLAPVLLAALVAIARREAGWARRAAQALLAVSAVAGAAAIGYRTVQAVDSAADGRSVDAFAAAVASLRGETARVGVDGPLVPIVASVLPGTPVGPWPLYDIVKPPHPPADYDRMPAILVVKQADTGRMAPAPPPGYRVVLDRFTRDAPRVFGVRYARTLKDYGFAVLCRADACREVRARTAGADREGGSTLR